MLIIATLLILGLSRYLMNGIANPREGLPPSFVRLTYWLVTLMLILIGAALVLDSLNRVLK